MLQKNTCFVLFFLENSFIYLEKYAKKGKYPYIGILKESQLKWEITINLAQKYYSDRKQQNKRPSKNGKIFTSFFLFSIYASHSFHQHIETKTGNKINVPLKSDMIWYEIWVIWTCMAIIWSPSISCPLGWHPHHKKNIKLSNQMKNYFPKTTSSSFSIQWKKWIQ